MSPLLANLNPEQLSAVTLPRESALILAGAGSGKTKVLTTRIAWLIQTGQVSPAGVLAVTFTNKAAKEMLHRLEGLLPINTRGMWVGTFHGLCNRLLRAHWREAALPQTFQILDTADQLSAIKRLYKTIGADDDKFPPKQTQYFINSAKEQGLRPAEVGGHDPHSRKMTEFYTLYQEQCEREGVVDFAELLLRAFELLQRQPHIAHHYRERFQYVLVDEFQDTNPLQYAWLKAMAGPQGCMFAVGDDDQSIYAFRGARVANMAEFERDYAVRHRIKLEQNYRSVGHVLNAANHLISHNRARLGKNLWTQAGEGEPLRVSESPTDLDEARWLLQEIQALTGEGMANADMAILYRSNAQSRVIEQALFTAGIPYRVYGGLRFFERAEIKHALAYLRLVENADDDTSFLRVVNFPTRGIGARSLEVLQDAARQHRTSLYRAVPHVGGKAGASLAGFVQLIERMRFEARGLSLPEVVAKTNDASGLVAHYQAEREGEERLENLRELVNAAAAFVMQEGYGIEASATEVAASETEAQILTPLAGFLSHASLEAGDNQAQQGQDAVQLMTVHASKGLEFKAVFVTGLEEGLFPHENSIGSSVLGSDGSAVEGVEEERRLMYVAMTRARERLYLSFAQQRMLNGQTRYCLRSRFLDELPDASVRWLAAPRPSAFNAAWNGQEQTGYGRSEGGYSGNGGYGGYGANGSGRAGGRSGGGASNAAVQRSAYGRGPGYGSTGSAPRAEWPFRIGQSVRHPRFGHGVVVSYEGDGDDLRIQVNFGRDGMKWLVVALAKLQAV